MVMLAVFAFTFVSCGDDGGDDPAPATTEYTIKYDANGGTGTIANTTYKAGEKVTLSDGSGFTREGYVFTGWSDKADGTTLDVNAIANKNVTLYAVWTKSEDNNPTVVEFTIKYDANGGTGTIANTTFKVGEKPVISTGEGLSRDGYIFKGWSTSADGTEIDESAFTKSTEVTLYAVWEKSEDPLVTITLDLDGGAFVVAELPTSFTVKAGTVIAADNEKLAVLVPAKDGFTFKGWSAEKGGAVLTSFTADKDATLYAVWEKIEQPAEITMVVRVNGVEGNKVNVTGYIDGFAGRTDIDATKISLAGFAIELKSANKIPDNTSKMTMAQMGNDGGFTADIEIAEAGEYVINAFVLYDNNPKVSEVATFTIEEKNNGGNEGGNVLPETLPAFFPTGYDKANVVAWYSVTLKDAEEIRTESVFLFDDKGVVVSKNQIKADGRVTRSFTFEYEVMADVRLPLQYELTEGSTYENGTANVGVALKPDATQAFINNGVLSIPAFAAETQYTIQNLADIPDAQDPTK